jgi:4-amino-4-deoxy-L-arabinose transferase-like glycosyltransferase
MKLTVSRLMVLVVAVITLLRLCAIDADPSTLVATDHFTDEGWYSLNARNRVLFGDWVMEEHNSALVLCPLYTLILEWTYALFGVSFLTTRLPSAIASVLVVALVALRLAPQGRVALLGAALVACNPVLFAYSQAAFAENVQLLFLAMVWFLASSPRYPDRWRAVLAGMAAVAAIAAKASAHHAFLIAALPPLLHVRARGAAWLVRSYAWLGLGGLLCALPMAFFLYPFREQLGQVIDQASRLAFSVEHMVIGTLLMGWKPLAATVSLESYYAGLLPAAFVFGLAAFWLLWRPLAAPDEQTGALTSAVTVATWTWLVGAFLATRSLGSIQYLQRHWLNMLVPMSILIAQASAIALDGRPARPPSRARSLLAMGFLLLGPAFLLRDVAIALADRFEVPTRTPAYMAWVGGLSVSAIVLAVLGARRSRLDRWIAGLLERHHPRAFGAISIAALAWFVVTLGPHLARPAFTIREASRALVEPGVEKRLMGAVANTLAIETPYFAFVRRDNRDFGHGDGYLNWNWQALRPTHELIATRVEGQPAVHRPPVLPAAEPAGVFELGRGRDGTPRLVVLVFTRRS